MNKSISIVKQARQTILNDIGGLSLDQLNIIPKGFNNNIIWHLGHLVAAQQSICYKRCGLPLAIDERFFELYKPGSKPDGLATQADLEKIKGLLFTTLDKLVADLSQDIFTGYPSWTTRYGVNVDSIDDAIVFLPFHEGLHAGTINAYKRLIIAS